MPSIPHACQGLHDELEAAYKELEAIQSSPNYIQHSGSQPGKPNPGALREAEQQEQKIAEINTKYDDCLRAHGVEPELISTFSGTATLESPLGSGQHHFSITLDFKAPHHSTFSVTEFPPLEVEAGGHTLTITQTGGGNGTFDSHGKMTLHIDLDVDAAWPGGHMDLAITLSSAHAHGSAMNSHGKVTLTGSATGHGHGVGFPDSVEVTMIAEGTVSPHP